MSGLTALPSLEELLTKPLFRSAWISPDVSSHNEPHVPLLLRVVLGMLSPMKAPPSQLHGTGSLGFQRHSGAQ